MAGQLPHEEFVRLSLCTAWKPSLLSTAASLCRAGGFDWPATLALARAEFISPLLFRAWREAETLPPAILDELHSDYLFWARRNMVLFHELAQVLQALEAAGVPAILLKGAALAEELYDNIALRPLRDVDLLVPPPDGARALKLLEALGYRPAELDVRPASTFVYENEILLVKAGAEEIVLELHWSLLDSIHHQRVIEMEWFWETAVPVRIDGRAAQMLGPEAQILHLCSHLALHHQSTGLLWFNDIALALARYGDRLDWDELTARAQQFDLVRPLRDILLAVVEEWHVNLPSDVEVRLSHLIISAQEQRVYERHATADRPVAQRFWTDLRELPGLAARLRFAWIHLFPSPAYMRERYAVTNRLLLPAYYPYRWWLGVRSVVKTILSGKGNTAKG